jgi:hypothetical protein
VGKAYGLVMRMACVPFKDRKLIGDLCRRHAMELGRRQE